MTNVFISHSSRDEEAADLIARAIQSAGVKVFYSSWALSPGDSLVNKIDTGIADASVLVILLSKSAVESPWVRMELNAFLNRSASERDIRIIPVLLEDVEVPPLLRDRLYLDLRGDKEAAISELIAQLALPSTGCASLPNMVLIDNFDAGTVRPNLLGGLTLVYHGNGDPASLRASFINRGTGRSLGLSFDFTSHSSTSLIPPQFVGYATRLQFANWATFVECGYWLRFDVRSDGNAPSIGLEIKRLASPPQEASRQEIAKWQIDLPLDWETRSLRLADIQLPNSHWDNLWEICFVLLRDHTAGDKGLVQIDNLMLSRTS